VHPYAVIVVLPLVDFPFTGFMVTVTEHVPLPIILIEPLTTRHTLRLVRDTLSVTDAPLLDLTLADFITLFVVMVLPTLERIPVAVLFDDVLPPGAVFPPEFCAGGGVPPLRVTVKPAET
jgi:hypothetical protein